MSIFDLGSDVVQEVEQDRLGGGTLDSDIYDFKIELAYLGKAKSGATSINLVLKTKDGLTLRDQDWISSGDAKGNSMTYVKDGKKYPLPGYAKLDMLCKLAIGKPLKEMEPEDKVIKLYDFDAKKEVPTQVPVLTELLGADITAGVLKVVVDKTKQNPSTGSYEPTGETREVNEVDKLFRTEDHLTGAEIAAEATEPDFYNKWKDKNQGQVRNKAKGASGESGTAGIPASSGKAPEPKKSLFA